MCKAQFSFSFGRLIQKVGYVFANAYLSKEIVMLLLEEGNTKECMREGEVRGRLRFCIMISSGRVIMAKGSSDLLTSVELQKP